MDQVSKREVHGSESLGHALSVLPLTPTHVLEIIKIAEESFEVVWGEEAFSHFINNKDGVCKGLFLDGQLVGYFLGTDIQGDLDVVSIATAKKYRRLGFAKLLLESVLSERKGQSFLEVDLRNTSARAFYLKMGFEEGRIRKAYYQGKHDAICMARS